MPPKSKLEKFRDEVIKSLYSKRSYIDPRTRGAIESKIYRASTINKLNNISIDLHEINNKTKKYKVSDIKEITKDRKEFQKIMSTFMEPKTKKAAIVPKEREYFISGSATVKDSYTYGKVNKKTKLYNNVVPVAYTIKAKSREEAKDLFEDYVYSTVNKSNTRGEESPDYYTRNVEDVKINNISTDTSFAPSSELTSHMRRANPIIYDFIPNDEKFNKNDNFCVPDTFVSIYSQYMKSLNYDKFIDLCYLVRGEDRTQIKQISLLDVGVEDDDDEDDNTKWTIEKGVSPEMLYKICVMLDISHYAFDITKQCFLKHLSKNQNYPALVYYCVNNHMYWISDKEKASSLIARARDVEK